MISKKIAQRVKELEIYTRRILNGSNIGGYKSSQKGFGFEFDQLRPYQYGDDIRLIDWKASAKGSGILLRQYHEERNRTFMICLDVSASTHFGSGQMLKEDIMRQVAGVLSLAAEYSKDKVGLILFSDRIEAEIPPGRGQQHTHRIIEKIFTHKPQGKATDINVLCDHVLKKTTKNSLFFFISDFISNDFSQSLKKLTSVKEVIAVSCLDHQETELAQVGLMWMQDPETQEQVLVHTKKSKHLLQQRLQEHTKLFAKHRVDYLQMKSTKNFIHDLVLFFQNRLMY